MATPPDPVFVLRGSDFPITAIKFLSEENQVLVSGNQNGCVQMWDLRTYRNQHSFIHATGKSVLWIDKMPGSESILTQSREGSVCLWREQNGNFTKTSSYPSGSMGFCAGCLMNTKSNSPILVVPSSIDQSQVDLVDINNKISINKFKPSSDISKQGMCMAIKSADVNQILIGYESGCVILWDFSTNQVLDMYQAHPESLMCLDYSETSNIGISGSANSTISSWGISKAMEIAKHKEVEIKNPGLNAIKIRADQKLLATAGWDGQIRLFGLQKLSPLAVLSCHTDSVQCITFSSDKLLACGSKDKRISVWDIYR